MNEDNNKLDHKDKIKELIVEQLKKTPIIQAVCEKINIARSKFYRWRKEDEIFGEQIEESLLIGRNLVNDLAESKLISGIKENNMSAIQFWLRHNHKKYSNRLELTGKLKTDSKLTPEQKEEIARVLKFGSLIVNKDKKI